MIYIFFSAVFITLFLFVGALSLYGFFELMLSRYPIGWSSYQYVFVLAILAALCFIAAALFGTQIPDCYATTII